MRWLLAVALLAGCSKKADRGPSCAEVTDHMLEVTRQQLTGHGEMELGNRKAMIAQCEERKMPAATRKCLVAATDLPAIAACRAGKKPEPDPETAPAAPASAPRPTAGPATPAPATP